MIKPYNRLLAVRYAQKWALGANPEYYHFGGIGGDCTNFISQCLFAGGGEMVKGESEWFYYSKDNRSPSWTSVEALGVFLTDDRQSLFASKREVKDLDEGDIIQLRQNPLRFNHSLIISKKQNGQIYVCAHSNDALDKNLNDYFAYEMIGFHIEGIKRQ